MNHVYPQSGNIFMYMLSASLLSELKPETKEKKQENLLLRDLRDLHYHSFKNTSQYVHLYILIPSTLFTLRPF